MRAALVSFTIGLLSACAPDLPASAQFVVEPIAERIVEHLPEDALYWRIETFPELEAAEVAAGPLSLAAETSGRAWLFTLGRAGERTSGATFVSDLGPVPRFSAARYRLRVNRAQAPPGHATSVHTHPGSEAFYVLSGQLSQRTAHGVARVDAGGAMNGHAPGMVMQLVSTGEAPLDQFVLFVVDADQPFSSPARFR